MEIFTGLDLPEEAKTTLKERIEKEIEAQKEGVKNDPEFLKQIRSEEAGKFFKSQEKIYRKVFPELKLEDIDGDGLTRMEAIAKAGVATLEKTKDATNQELQDKYLKLNQEFETYKTETVPGLLTEKDAHYQQTFINDGLFKDCVNIESTIKPEFRPALVDAYLSTNGLKKVWDADKKTYEFTTLDNLKPTKDGKPLAKTDIIEAAIDAAGGLVKSNGKPDNTDPEKRQQRPRPEVNDRAKQYLESIEYTPRQ